MTPSMTPGDASERPVAWEPVLGERGGPGAWIGYAAYRAAIAGLLCLPLGWQRAFARGFARLAKRFDRRHSDAARRYLAQAFPELSDARREELVAISWAHFFEVALATSELAALEMDELRARFEFERTPELERVFARSSGAVFVSPHLGNWEAALLAIPGLGFDPAYAVSRPPKNRPLSRYMQSQREKTGTWLLGRHGAFKRAMRVVRGGGYVAMLTDQRARIAPVVVPVFGRPAHTEQGPALLLLRCKVPIAIGACLALENRRFRIRIPYVLWPEDWAGAEPAAITAAVVAAMEELIRANPEQYVWIHDRYYKAPPFPAPPDASEASDGPGAPGEPGTPDAAAPPLRAR